MIAASHIIRKEDLFEFVATSGAARVELAHRYNKSLRDQSLCKVVAYYQPVPSVEYRGMIGSRAAERHKVPPDSADHAFLTGIASAMTSHVTATDLARLIAIRKSHGLGIAIPRGLMQFSDRLAVNGHGVSRRTQVQNKRNKNKQTTKKRNLQSGRETIYFPPPQYATMAHAHACVHTH